MKTQCLQKTHDRLLNSWQSSVSFFRQGEDQSGLDALLDGIEDLECMLDSIGCTGEAGLITANLLPNCRQLLTHMQNRDVTGLTDLLEFTLVPLLKIWAARWDA